MMSSKLLVKRLLFFILIINVQSMNAQAQTADQSLTIQQKSMVTISALTATGNTEKLKTVLNKGLDAGLTVNQIKEELVQLYAYCGFPRSLNAINAFIVVLDQRKAREITDQEGSGASPVSTTDKYETGRKNLQVLTGVEEAGPKKGANGFAPLIDTFLKEHLFADIFSRDLLTFQQRELITISTLAALTGVESQLQAHIGMGMNTGITEKQLADTFGLIEKTVSKDQADIARAALKKVIASKK
ncbi:alkylhydroperoxidase/carboxymuconolactone decarboxylase family protein YurZ [Pedobacter cryoconitis]|uniref:Alkylhydroperoxidase/carboxymuconolactone decarboxylase family protein YurZ n=1 Tax=Pedobacter cryoconitis TaxID=188932 RepID=A0A7W8YUC2_9SPHI|nr:carboxymuconolactone decarboxylase family protein [Pedobacter cryoconitis]MBB5621918.1 alkylhydroperoxidase/carboxymuconolactone decarboxylase family protein YurZ [Pedobacter cryoconitis]